MSEQTTPTGYTFGVEIELGVENIVPNPAQPREYFNPEEIEQLAAGMKDYKQVTAIEVFPLECQAGQPQKFMIKSGERRWRAAKANQQPTIRAIIGKPPEDENALFLDSYLANSAVPHSAVEHYRAMTWMQNQLGLSPKEIARRTGRKQSWVEQYLSLEALNPAVLDLLDPSKTKDPLPLGQALQLIEVDSDLQLDFAKIIQTRGLSGPQTTALLRDAPKRSVADRVKNVKSQDAEDARKLVMFQTLVQAIHRGAQQWDGENLQAVMRIFPTQPPSIRTDAIKSLRAAIASLEALASKIDPNSNNARPKQ